MTARPDAAHPRFAEVQAEILSRAPEHSPQPSLERVAAVLELLGDPQRAYPVIQVTGTNGKTSTARMIDRLLREHGLRTGRFTSPHLAHIGERVTVDGVRLGPTAFVEAWDDIAPYVGLVDERSQAADGPRLSFFEVLTCMAYAVFADAPVDVAVVEVGLGGTWDSTNVADATVAVIAPIAMDHETWLGHTVEQIAAQKAGIIAEGTIAVLAEQPAEAVEILLARVREMSGTALQENSDFGVLDREPAVGGQRLTLRGLVGGAEDVYLPLHGAHQAHNAALAMAAVEAFLGSGGEAGTGLDPDLVRDAFAHVDSPARLEAVRRGPLVVVDAAHNPAGAAALAAGLAEAFPGTHLVGVVGVMADKDADGILAALEPALAHVVLTHSRSARAMDLVELTEAAQGVFGADRVQVEPDLAAAIDLALGTAETEATFVGGVVVTGSVYLAGEARSLLGAPDPDAVTVDTTRRGVSAVADDTEAELFGGHLDDLLGDDGADGGSDGDEGEDAHDVADSDLLDDIEEHLQVEDADSEWERSMGRDDDDA